MSNTTNTTLTEIAALVLAVLLVIAGTFLFFFGKINFDNSIFFFISALGIFGYNSAWKAPSPAQQSQLMALMAQQQAPPPPVIINNNIPPVPVAPVVPTSPVQPTISQFKSAASVPEFTAPLEVVKP